MSYKIPENRKWTVDPSKDTGLALLATKNMNFDKQGFASLASRAIALFRESELATFEIPHSVYNAGNGITKIMTSDNGPHTVDFDDLLPTFSEDALASQPSGSTDGSGTNFDGKWVITESADMNSYDGAAWTDHSVTLSSGKRHPLCEMKSNRTLLIGNGAQVKQVNTAFTETTNLTLPSGLEVCGLAYNRSMAAIITIDTYENEAWLFIWDGATAAANYSYPLGAVRAICIVPYKDTFVIVNGNGQLLYWTTAGLRELAILPAYVRDSLWASSTTSNKGHDTSIIVDGDRILFNVCAEDSSRNSERDRYNPMQPAGVWCYDPKVGLYHRHAPTGCRLFGKTVSTANVNIATGVITVSATGGDVPATGTPALYSAFENTPIALTEMVPYYVIKLSATTFKLAATRADAAAGTAVAIANTGNSLQQIAFLEEYDFGQLAPDDLGGVMAFTGPTPEDFSGGKSLQYAVFNRYCFGQGQIPHRTAAVDYDAFMVVSNQGENRGYILTQKIPAEGIIDDWGKIFLKPRGLNDVDDKMIAKYRKTNVDGFPIFARNTTQQGVWVDENTFTTVCDLAAAKTAFDAGRKYEIEFILGAGSGYLAHISAISYAGGTYTVTIDEDIRGIAAADTCYFVVDNWEKLYKASSSSAEITSADDPNVVELPIGGEPSPWIQFKVEYRGRNVDLEEMEIINTPQQVAV